MIRKILLIFIFASESSSKLILEKFEMCDPTKNEFFSFYQSLKTINNVQYMDYNWTNKDEWGDNQWVKAQMKLVSGVVLASTTERNPCKFFNAYIGELWYAFQRAGHESPSCPIRKGLHVGKNLRLDMNRVTLQALPHGRLIVSLVVLTKNKRNELACYKIVVNSVA